MGIIYGDSFVYCPFIKVPRTEIKTDYLYKICVQDTPFLFPAHVKGRGLKGYPA